MILLKVKPEEAVTLNVSEEKNVNLKAEAVRTVGVPGGGTNDHNELINKELPDQHPMSSITGLEEALSNIELTPGPPGPAGPPGRDGSDGKDGVDGQPGYSPIRGVDYWTDEDKQEIIGEMPDPDLTGYATEEFVSQKIAEAQLGGGGGGSVDLSAYYTKSETDEAIRAAVDEVELIPGPAGADGLPGEPGKDGSPGADGITPHIGENSNWFIGDTDTGVRAVGKDGEPGQDGTPGRDGKDGYTPIKGVDYFDGQPGPAGADGNDGKDGEPGKDGYSPVKGVDYFDGKDGEPGKDGYTPVKGVDYFDGEPGAPGSNGEDGITPHIGENGNWYTGETDTGVPATGPAGSPGQDGSPGADGKTPVRGTDYWTAADKQEILAETASMYPVVHTGTSAPASSLGKNGDLYLRVY